MTHGRSHCSPSAWSRSPWSPSFWVVLIFSLESLLFILIGLQFPGVLDGLSGYSTAELLLYAAVVSAVVMGSGLLFPVTVRGVRRVARAPHRPAALADLFRERAVVGWSGMRGAVTLAAALAIPLTTDAGTPFPQRDLQGPFWEMYDRLFRARRRLEPDDLRRYARELGLDLERFDAELAGEVHLQRVLEQRAGGERSGVTATPAFFVGDEQHAGFYDEETLTEALRSGPEGARWGRGRP